MKRTKDIHMEVTERQINNARNQLKKDYYENLQSKYQRL